MDTKDKILKVVLDNQSEIKKLKGLDGRFDKMDGRVEKIEKTQDKILGVLLHH